MNSWGPLALLLATVINQLPIVSALMPTEPVYLYLGTRLADGGGWTSLAFCVLGAWIGNQGSYWLGRRVGTRLVARMKVGAGALARAQQRFNRWGPGFVIVSQLIWPIATLMQVMAGVWGMRPWTFFVVSGFGAVLAIAQYAFVGWLTAVGLDALGLRPTEELVVWLGPYFVLIGFVLLLAAGAALILLRGRHILPLRVVYVALWSLAMLIAVNLGALAGHSDARAKLAPIPRETACRALDETLIARTGTTPLHAARPINIALVGVPDPSALLESLGWLRNRTYAGAPLDAPEILSLLRRGLPPAGTPLLDGVSTDMAWQAARGTIPRTALHLWPVATQGDGPMVWLGSLVQVDAVTLRLAGQVPTLAYDLDPMTDRVRDQQAARIASALGTPAALRGPTDTPTIQQDIRVIVENEFRSDGLIAELRQPGAPTLSDMCQR